MPAPPRILIKGKLHLISTRVERGLPFVCTAYMNLVIMSVMARAQALYKVRVCAFIWMGNHLHMLIVVDCPASVTAFMDRIKTETSHAINRLTGERKLTNWCDSYDSPPILTVEDAIEKFVYLYANPAQANLEASISLYPGTSSWKLFSSRSNAITVPWIHRPMIEQLSSLALSEESDKALTQQLIDSTEESHVFLLSPDDWMECFNLAQSESEKYRWMILEGVKKREQELSDARTCKVIGARTLKAQRILHSEKVWKKDVVCLLGCRDTEVIHRTH